MRREAIISEQDTWKYFDIFSSDNLLKYQIPYAPSPILKPERINKLPRYNEKLAKSLHMQI